MPQPPSPLAALEGRLASLENRVTALEQRPNLEGRVSELEAQAAARADLLQCILESLVGGYARIPDPYVNRMVDWKDKLK